MLVVITFEKLLMRHVGSPQSVPAAGLQVPCGAQQAGAPPRNSLRPLTIVREHLCQEVSAALSGGLCRGGDLCAGPWSKGW